MASTRLSPNDRLANGVTLHSLSHADILRRYKPVTIARCLENSRLSNDAYDDWFEIDEAKSSPRRCIRSECLSISLFRRHPDWGSAALAAQGEVEAKQRYFKELNLAVAAYRSLEAQVGRRHRDHRPPRPSPPRSW